MKFPNILKSLAFRVALLSMVGLMTLSVIASVTIRTLLERDRIDLAHAVADIARSVAADYDKRARQGEFSQEEAIQRARKVIRAMRYQGDQYLFVVGVNGIMQVHPSGAEREGKDQSHEIDAKGFDFPPALVARAQEGGGTTFYYFPRPGAHEASRKVSYTLLYEPWHWVFGTGVYLDDIDQMFWVLMRTFSLLAGLTTISITVITYFISNKFLGEIERRRKAEQRALHSSKLASIGQMAAGIAHEINTPIQYIGDNIRFLREEEENLLKIIVDGTTLSESEASMVSEDLSSAAKESLEGIDRISRIVSSLKDFSRPGTTDETILNINDSLENTLTISRHAWAPIAEIECIFAPDLPSARGPVSEVNQVFLSVILNAVQAISEGGKSPPGRIQIETLVEGKEIVIRISDNGPGVPQALRERIFEPFFSTKPVGSGIGQGLAVGRDTIEVKCGGRLEVGGIPGEGAIFTIRLPIDTVRRNTQG
ncbi:MAG: cache domain-containing protein [Rhodospirillum sp.]|nr:cache domain-containing protein [Rhodospirillum sp.]MCF8487686.1 cache domain-containing protein [Rhodospirillum sp.]MCF8499582.1 cache domain-containing protein [Rhodospirillum sp.]